MTGNPFIQSIGCAVPDNKIPQKKHYAILEAATEMEREEQLKLRLIYSRSGIESRYSVLSEFGREEQEGNILFYPANHHPAVPVSLRMDLYEKYAAELSQKAVAACLADLPTLSPDSITHLITFSCTGMSAPGTDIQLIELFGLSRNIERTCINFMGCQAAVNALKVADYIARSNADAIVLISGVELCTLHYQKSESQDQMLANALFADGAAAAIISSKDLRSTSHPGFLLRAFHSEFDPAGSNEMVWRVGDFGFDIRLSAYVPDLIKNKIAELTTRLFKKNNISPEDIDLYALHPGGIKILEACEAALGIGKEKNAVSYAVLKEYGNMSSVTILFVLKQYMMMPVQEIKGKKILGCAFGPGLTMESMLLEVN